MTKTEAPIEEATVIGDEFDPAATTVEYMRNVATKKECAAVLAHYGLPKVPASWKLSDFRKLASAPVMAAAAEQAAVDVVEATVEPEKVTESVIEAQAIDPAEVTSTAIEQRRPDAVNVFPEASKWQQITSMSVAIHKSSLCPAGLKKPEDVAVVLLAANDLGIPLTQALDKIYVIKGKKGMAAELMIALAQRDGHVVQDAGSNSEVGRVFMRRRDTGAESTFEFTIDEAIEAKLVARDGGKLKALSDKDVWVKFTADMLWARAVSRGCRRMFPDVLAGVSYTPDELGYIDADDDLPKRGPNADATVTIEQRRNEIGARIAEVKARAERTEGGAAIREAANAEARRRSLPPVRESTAGALSGWAQVMAQAEEALDKLEAGQTGADGNPIDEAEVVVEPEGPNPGADEAEKPEEAETGPAEPDSGTGPLSGSEEESPSGVEIHAEEICACEACGKTIEPGDSTVEGPDGKTYLVGHEPF